MNAKNATINITEKKDYHIISLTGSLEYGIIETAKAKLQNLVLQTGQGYVIDLQKVENIDSTGFGMIVNFAKKVAVQGKKIVIIVVDDFVRNLFAISQCDKVFPIVKSEEEAKNIMNGEWKGELSINEY